jgi:hypothetical protein
MKNTFTITKLVLMRRVLVDLCLNELCDDKEFIELETRIGGKLGEMLTTEVSGHVLSILAEEGEDGIYLKHADAPVGSVYWQVKELEVIQ